MTALQLLLALALCVAVAVSREYGGTQRGYDAQRTAYDAAMQPVERARALLAEVEDRKLR